MGERLCKDPVNVCDCQSGSGRGAVVVRWRVADVEIGRLLPRGMCCCNPSDNVSATLRQQCGTTGNQCLLSPAWLLRKVQLHITPVEPVGETCVVTAPCSDGELTTQYCLVPGVYDLQLRGALEAVDGDEFACAQRSAVSPPAVRRVVSAAAACGAPLLLAVGSRRWFYPHADGALQARGRGPSLAGMYTQANGVRVARPADDGAVEDALYSRDGGTTWLQSRRPSASGNLALTLRRAGAAAVDLWMLARTPD